MTLVPVSLRGYRRSWLAPDVLAGVTLAAVAIPACLGYSKLAGTPIEAGLYTLIFPAIAFALFGFSRLLVVGGDATTAMLIYSGIAGAAIPGVTPGSGAWLAYASAIALMTAGFLLVFRLFRLGFLSDFLSTPVQAGFLAGVGIQVAVAEIPPMLGMETQSNQLFVGAWQTITSTGRIDLGAAILSGLGLLLLLLLARPLDRFRVPAALVYVVAAIAASLWLASDNRAPDTIGPVPGGLPTFEIPDVDLSVLPVFLGTAFGIALLTTATSAATARAFASRHGDPSDTNRDLVGLSAANIAAGFTGTFVTNGSGTRTAVVDRGHARSQLAMIVAALVTMVVLQFGTTWIEALPKAALATIVFVLGITIIDVATFRRLWQRTRREFWLATATAAVVAAVGVQQGLVLAVLLSLVLVIRNLYAKTDITVHISGTRDALPAGPGLETAPGLVVFRFRTGLWFANAHRFIAAVEQTIEEAPHRVEVVILDASAIGSIDYTAATLMSGLHDYLAARGIHFLVAGADTLLIDSSQPYGIVDLIGHTSLFTTLAQAEHRAHSLLHPDRS